jgi:hypothetical protein
MPPDGTVGWSRQDVNRRSKREAHHGLKQIEVHASRDLNHLLMRKPTASLGYLALLLPPLLATCTAPTRWKKAGADAATMAKETADCRVVGREEALRRYPYGFSGPAGGMVISQQRDDTQRAVVKAASFNSCMQAKGYAPPSSQ